MIPSRITEEKRNTRTIVQL